jgi:ligand-binding sensor domain-containing protein
LDLPPDWKGAIEPLFVYQSQSGDVWVGGNQGIAVHRQGQWQTFDRNQGYLGEGAQCLLETPDGKLWCGSRDRIFQFDGKKWSLLQSKLDRINAFGKSRDGNVWVASSSGLYCYSKGSWILNTAEDGLPSSTVFDVYEDSRGEIWAGTTRGLSLYHRDADVDSPKTFITKVNHKIKPSPTEWLLCSAVGRISGNTLPPIACFTRIALIIASGLPTVRFPQSPSPIWLPDIIV